MSPPLSESVKASNTAVSSSELIVPAVTKVSNCVFILLFVPVIWAANAMLPLDSVIPAATRPAITLLLILLVFI